MTPNVGLIFQGGGGGLLEMGFKGAMSAGELPRWGYAITFNCQNSIVFITWLSLSITSLVMSDQGPSISSARRKVLRQFYRCSFEVKMQPFIKIERKQQFQNNILS